MPSHDNLHSRLVAWLKILLPLAALAILSTLFLFSRSIDPGDAIPYAEVDVEQLAREPRVGAPEFSGVTEDGAAVIVRADAARPDPADSSRVSATGLFARMEAEGGLVTDLTAAQGRIDPGASLLTLEGGVRIITSTGYAMETEGLTATLDRTHVESAAAVRAQAPYGVLTAGGMVLDHRGEGAGGHVLLFKDGVKLIYDPRN